MKCTSIINDIFFKEYEKSFTLKSFAYSLTMLFCALSRIFYRNHIISFDVSHFIVLAGSVWFYILEQHYKDASNYINKIIEENSDTKEKIWLMKKNIYTTLISGICILIIISIFNTRYRIVSVSKIIYITILIFIIALPTTYYRYNKRVLIIIKRNLNK